MRPSIGTMPAVLPLKPNPWTIELIVVKGSHSNLERVALSRDVQRGLFLRLRKSIYVERIGFEQLSSEEQHVVRMRAVAAASDAPVVFSHFSAAIALGLPVLRGRLRAVHTTVASRGERGRIGVVGHLLPLDPSEVEPTGDLLVTTTARTVLDIAAAAPFEEGVMAADAALQGGTPRETLEAAADLLGARQGLRRIADVVAFAHPGGESAAESRSRTTLFRIGVEPPELQHRLILFDDWEVYLDMLFPRVRVGGEVDGAMKLLDPAIAPEARKALLWEKRREDAARLQLQGLARWGWVESGSPALLAAVLRQVGVHPAPSRPTLADYAALARTARPRPVPIRDSSGR